MAVLAIVLRPNPFIFSSMPTLPAMGDERKVVGSVYGPCVLGNDLGTSPPPCAAIAIVAALRLHYKASCLKHDMRWPCGIPPDLLAVDLSLAAPLPWRPGLAALTPLGWFAAMSEPTRRRLRDDADFSWSRRHGTTKLPDPLLVLTFLALRDSFAHRRARACVDHEEVGLGWWPRDHRSSERESRHNHRFWGMRLLFFPCSSPCNFGPVLRRPVFWGDMPRAAETTRDVSFTHYRSAEAEYRASAVGADTRPRFDRHGISRGTRAKLRPMRRERALQLPNYFRADDFFEARHSSAYAR